MGQTQVAPTETGQAKADRRPLYRDLGASAVLILVAAFFVRETLELPGSGRGQDSLDARAIPLALLAVIILLSVVIAVRATRRRVPAEADPAASGAVETASEEEAPAPHGLARSIGLAGLLVGYALLLEYTGPAIASIAFAATALLLLTGDIVKSAVLSLVIAVLLYLVFVTLLGVRFDNDLIGNFLGA